MGSNRAMDRMQDLDRKVHWENIYQTKAPKTVSWYQAKPALSLALIAQATSNRDAHLIDVGSGTSTLLNLLLECGYQNITAVDISASALHKAQQQLGPCAAQVKWIEADVTRLSLPPNSIDVWHDRAVYHFLTRTCDR